ncbi:hypothetical protein [Proteiniphilum sp. X52]|uniref:hypothetical protein n=1 Tax=Proteiniphilum sp. X52 TaxID=2382159 RepID=UPI000F0A1DC8|nr:hypothetical protein [Proteiniphilum sp. X52]RNC63270.1 hypothetical protein D7D25_17425 [Proteiniphilum sp. X52]
MKRKTFLFAAISLLLLLGGAGCEKEGYSDYVEGYIVASFQADKIGEDGIASGRTPIGFCILLENSKNENSNYPIDFYTFNLPDGLLDFPKELIVSGCNGNNCGPIFFPENKRTSYKIRFNYKVLKESENMNFVCGPCTAMEHSFPWKNYSEILLKSIVKLEK